jgi:hypothetical protein
LGRSAYRSGRHRWLRAKPALKRVALLFATTALALAVAEVVVRYTRGGYDVWRQSYAHDTDPKGIVPTTNYYYYRENPESKEQILVIENGLGCSQHRDFDVVKPEGMTRIGVFGDSFTESMYLDAPYRITEPLDYLLNRTGRPFEVINFGKEGWAADQSYTRYIVQGRQLDLDVVIYLFFDNDIADLCHHSLFDVDAEGDFREPIDHPGLYCRTALECLYRDAADRESIRQDPSVLASWGSDGPPVEVPADSATIEIRYGRCDVSCWQGRRCLEWARPAFARILRGWNHKATERGGKFLMAMSDPYAPFTRIGIPELAASLGIPLLDLTAPFQEFERTEGIRYQILHDKHWNEEGAKVVAVSLFRFLAENLGLEGVGDAFVADGLAEYYRSFPNMKVTERWLAPERFPTPDQAATVRAKYLALESEIDGRIGPLN